MISGVRLYGDIIPPTGTSPCPVCRAPRTPRWAFGRSVWNWACPSSPCILRELEHGMERIVVQERQLGFWQEAA